MEPPLESERGAGCCLGPALCWGHPFLSLWPPCHDRGSSAPCQEGSHCLSLNLPPSHLLCSPARAHGPHLAPAELKQRPGPKQGATQLTWHRADSKSLGAVGGYFGVNCLWRGGGGGWGHIGQRNIWRARQRAKGKGHRFWLFKPRLSYLQARDPYASYTTSFGLSFLICPMGITALPS